MMGEEEGKDYLLVSDLGEDGGVPNLSKFILSPSGPRREDGRYP